ncbi:hypothetical protein FRC17_006188 [Serendipita sp. 399]|nr:hypothetical protein FRC17_006188 [Serendipita sp. 399]
MSNVREFDFAGLFLSVTGVVCILLGFNYAETSWSDKKTIAFLVVGVVLFALCAINEALLPPPPPPPYSHSHSNSNSNGNGNGTVSPPTSPTAPNHHDVEKPIVSEREEAKVGTETSTPRTGRNPIFPPRMFKTRTTAGLLFASAIQMFAFTGASYYLPNYFQVLGASATNAGLKMIPFSFGGAVCAIVAGQVLSRTGSYRPILWISSAIVVLGYGLFYMLDVHTSVAVQVVLLLVSACGIGPLFPVPLIGMFRPPSLGLSLALRGWMCSPTSIDAAAGHGDVYLDDGAPTVSGRDSRDFDRECDLSVRVAKAAAENPGVSPEFVWDDKRREDVVAHSASRSEGSGVACVYEVDCAHLDSLLRLLPVRHYSLQRQVKHGEKRGSIQINNNPNSTTSPQEEMGTPTIANSSPSPSRADPTMLDLEKGEQRGRIGEEEEKKERATTTLVMPDAEREDEGRR